ncbi:hypothetical protein [Leucobacter luti]|uniref:hypothetical protein n=1 Tax=Leucobacter luti TaxID=340320 RepID=UPI00102CDE6E|nr:hypothetical protein [Leucobacter luti]MBL3699010.1 hypothetical protein [Leucobacter luti]
MNSPHTAHVSERAAQPPVAAQVTRRARWALATRTRARALARRLGREERGAVTAEYAIVILAIVER